MAARKPAPARKATVSSIASTKVDFDLDSFESERKSYKPFVARVGGASITFVDPASLDYRDLMSIDDPDSFAENCIVEKDREAFLGARITVDQMVNGLMPAYRDHYGMGDAQGN